ncbi:hypothetical protein Q8F55_004407 [Vanrija albida]|uniref:F-box domain-containing protein n=1 Tax=Vanrija albida TaxID=181172 RepID=A0ABR3Q6Y0_9TREE
MAASDVSMAGSSLLDLPGEILELILSSLGPSDISRVQRTCSAFRDMYLNSPDLRYRFALQTSGYLDVAKRGEVVRASIERPGSPLETNIKSPHTGRARPTLATVTLAPWSTEPPATRADYSALSTAEKAAALAARERRWDALEPAQIRTFTVSGRTGVYELQEGIFLMCEDQVLGVDKPRVIRLIPLPSVEDPDLEDPILDSVAIKVGFPIADLTMDPTQDLIVVSEYDPAPVRRLMPPPCNRYHLLAMSTGEPHPLASMPFLDFPPANVPTLWPRQLIQVMGDTLVALVSRNGFLRGISAGEEELVAWNWKTGEVLGRLKIGHTLTECSFAMLTPTTVLLSTASILDMSQPEVIDIHPPAIQILSFARDPALPKPTIAVPLTLDQNDHDSPRPTVIAKLLLPELANMTSIERFDMRPDPPFPPTSPKNQTLGRGKPFTQDPSRGVVVFEILVVGEDLPEFSYELFVLRETFVQMAHEGEERMRRAWTSPRRSGVGADDMLPNAVLRTYHWAEWGEQNARLQRQFQQRQRNWVCSCSGYRFASLQPHQDEDEEPDRDDCVDLVVFDFSPTSVRRTRAEMENQRDGSPKRRADQGDEDTPESRDSEALDKPDPKDRADGAGETTGKELQFDHARVRALGFTGHSANAEAYGRAEYRVELHDEPTEIPPGHGWAETVITRLPYRSATRTLYGRPNGVMIDDQRVLAVCTIDQRTAAIRQEVTTLCM